MCYSVVEGCSWKIVAFVSVFLTAAWLFLAFDNPRNIDMFTFALDGRQDALQKNTIPFLESTLPPEWGVQVDGGTGLNLAQASTDSGSQPRLYLYQEDDSRNEEVYVTFTLPNAGSSGCYSTFVVSYHTYYNLAGVNQYDFLSSQRVFNLTQLLPLSPTACMGPMLSTDESPKSKKLHLFGPSWDSADSSVPIVGVHAIIDISPLLIDRPPTFSRMQFLHFSPESTIQSTLSSFDSLLFFPQDGSLVFGAQTRDPVTHAANFSVWKFNAIPNATSSTATSELVSRPIYPNCATKLFLAGDFAVALTAQSPCAPDDTLPRNDDPNWVNQTSTLWGINLNSNMGTLTLEVAVPRASIVQNDHVFPFYTQFGLLYFEQKLLTKPLPKTKDRILNLGQGSQKADVTAYRGGPYSNYFATNEPMYCVVDTVRNMGYFLKFEGQPHIESQIYLQTPVNRDETVYAISPLLDSIQVKNGGFWDRAVSSWDVTQDPANAWDGFFLQHQYDQPRNRIFGLGKARRMDTLEYYHFFYSFRVDQRVEETFILGWNGFMWTSIIISIAISFQFSRKRYTTIEEYWKDLRDAAMAKARFLNWRRKQVEEEQRNNGRLQATCAMCGHTMIVAARIGDFQCEKCQTNLRVQLPGTGSTNELTSMSTEDLANLSNASGPDVLQKKKSEEMMRTVVNLSAVESDRYKRLSSMLRSKNFTHLVILMLEFWQLNAFSFSYKIPWSDDAGGLVVKNLFKFAMFDFAAMDINIPLLTNFVIYSSTAVFFLVGLFFLTVMWVRHSKVKLEKRYRMSPYCCYFPVALLQPITNVCFLPILRVTFANLSCSKLWVHEENNPANIGVLILDFAPVVCWQGSHISGGILSLLSIAAFLPLAIFLFPLWQELDGAKQEIKYKPSFLLFLPVMKLILVIAAYFFTTYIGVEVAASFIITLVLGGLTLKYRPCCVWSLNNWRAASFIAACWTSVCSFTALLLQESYQASYDSSGVDLIPLYLLYSGWSAILIAVVTRTYIIKPKSQKYVNSKDHFEYDEKKMQKKAETKHMHGHHAAQRMIDFEHLPFVDKVRISYQKVADQKRVENELEG